MVAYTGIETISNLAEEARDYKKTIPRGIGLVVGAVAVIYVFLPAIALSVMPVKDGTTALAKPQEQGGFADDPILGVVENIDLGPLQGPAQIYVGVLAATILFIATNAGLIGVSRLTYSMGQHRQLPEGLRKLHPRFRTPVRGHRRLRDDRLRRHPARARPTSWARSTPSARCSRSRWPTAAVTWLRLKHPEVDRPWKSPAQCASRGRELPLLAVLGGLGTGIAFVVVTVLDVRVLISGVVWLTIGITALRAVPAQPEAASDRDPKVVMPKPAVEHEVEYESVLVAFEDGRYSAGAVDTAVRLAARRRRGIHILVTITVPANAPIDAAMPEQESPAAAAVDSARVRGGRRVTGHWEKVRAGEAGRRILDEAREIKARAIVMSVPPKRTGSSLLGRTARRSCPTGPAG